jgi:hypothetical protein
MVNSALLIAGLIVKIKGGGQECPLHTNLLYTRH